MKQFLRPIGTCLTTAVMTSTLLESSALALSEPTSHPEGLATAAAELNSPPQSPSTVTDGLPTVAPPETQPTVERRLDPTPAATDPPGDTSPASEAPGSPPVPLTEAGAIASPDAVELVRRLLEERLAALVERDKPLKEAQLRDNLIASALYYAGTGEFEQARQTARHPALSEPDQAKLLAQIDRIAAQPPDPLAASPAAIATALPGAIATAPPPAARWSLPSLPIAPMAFCPAPVPTVHPQPIDKPGIEIAAAWSRLTLTPSAPDRPPTLPSTDPVILDRVVVAAAPPVSVPEVQQSLSLAHAPAPVAPDLAQANPLTVEDLQPLPDALQPQQWSRSPSSAPLPVAGSQSSDPLASPSPAIAKPLSATLASLPSVWPMGIGQWMATKPFEWNRVGGDRGTTTASMDSSAVTLPMPLDMGIQTLATPSVVSVGQHLLTELELALAPVAPQKQWDAAAKAAKSVTDPSAHLASCGGLSPVAFNQGNPVSTLLAQQLQRLGVMFPLPIPAAITSAFGWRIHPISGTRRFHEGVDFGAPYGTPVLAATAGRVVAAESMGGYGLTVIIENGTTVHRNLYAHLSGIAVQPGMQVEQGMVIGWVGSTGNSTGPHLHFEVQQQTVAGWSAIDPIALANSVR